MKRILYAAIFLLFYLSIVQSLHVKKYKNRALERRRGLFDGFKNGVRTSQFYKWQNGESIRRRGDNKDSSSVEKMKYQDEFRELHEQKKKEAFDAAAVESDEVNMVAARPRGVPCGDPDQHDMPWGTCMRPEQCPPGYRIPRGDYSCGYTTYVCCALQLTGDDTIVPLDVSFGSDFDDSQEHKTKKKPGKKSRKREDRRRRERERKKRKKRMKKIIKRITRIIERTFKNESRVRKKKTREFKKFLKRLKRKYDKSRLLVKDKHRQVLNRTDKLGMDRLQKIYEMNKAFVRNIDDTTWSPERNDVTEADTSTVVTESPDASAVATESPDASAVVTELPDEAEESNEKADEDNIEPSRRLRIHRRPAAHGYLNFYDEVGDIQLL